MIEIKRKNQEGVILILSLLMMAALLSSALAFVFFVNYDLSQSKYTDNSTVAYYGAETGLEASLYLLRKNGLEKMGSSTDEDLTVKKVLNQSDRQQLVTTNGKSTASWTIASSSDYESVFLRQRIYSGESTKVFFLNRASSTSGNIAKAIKVTWSTSTAENQPKVQINFTQLNPQVVDGNVVFLTDSSNVYNYPPNDNCLKFKDDNGNNSGITMADKKNYVVDFKIFGGSSDYIDRLVVTAYDDELCHGYPDQQAISNLTINSVGYYNGVSQNVVGQLSPRDPTSGLFGFALFSESPITKD